jgi:hypothetical protein
MSSNDPDVSDVNSDKVGAWWVGGWVLGVGEIEFYCRSGAVSVFTAHCTAPILEYCPVFC